mmetsp:Transcript_126299/g.252337  ORF Transcript_126299/g.252337 Transcript_126299/m.252337 type:complete len:475 (+) Transcript_126299:202-1626(+)
MRLYSGAVHQTRPSSKLIRPSNYYEYEWRNRQYGGEEKERRAEERKQQAALRAQGISTGSSTHYGRRAQLSRNRTDKLESKIGLRSWDDVARDQCQCWSMTLSTNPRPAHGPHTPTDVNHATAECVSGTCQISAGSISSDFSNNHHEPASVDPQVQVQLHIVKCAFDATAYGDGCLTLFPGDLVECIGHEQGGWIRGRRCPLHCDMSTGVGAVKEGWFPVDFAEPLSESARVDAGGSVGLGIESHCVGAVTDKGLAAATETGGEATSLEVAIYSFDGSRFGDDYMSLDVGDVVAFDGCEVDGWLLGRCIHVAQRCEVLKRGWYPQGFTQLLSELHAASVKEGQSVDADVSRGTLRSWNDVAQDRSKNWWVSSGSGLLRGGSPSLGEGTACHTSRAAEVIAICQHGRTHVKSDAPILVEPTSLVNGDLSRPPSDGAACFADGADKGNTCVTIVGNPGVEDLAEEPDAEQPPASAK